jgi:hypothetical protein
MAGANVFADEAGVSAFEYRLSAKYYSNAGTMLRTRAGSNRLAIIGESSKLVSGDSVFHIVETKMAKMVDTIEIRTVGETGFSPMPEYPSERPERHFRVEVTSLALPPDGLVRIRLMFRDATETLSLHYVKGEGLQLLVDQARFGKVDQGLIAEFANLEASENGITYQCNPLTTSASKDGQLLWSRDLAMPGQPESLRILKDVLFVTTTTGQSFYVMKNTGELVIFDTTVMGGKDPADDVLALWQRDMKRTFRERKKRGFFRYMRAAVMLNDRRTISLFIECVEKGQGLPEKCAAVAALERFNGNPALWVTNPRPSEMLIRVGMNRVFPADAAKAERLKWEAVFAGATSK